MTVPRHATGWEVQFRCWQRWWREGEAYYTRAAVTRNRKRLLQPGCPLPSSGMTPSSPVCVVPHGKGSAAVRQPAVGPLTGGPACVGPMCQGHHCRALNCSGSRSVPHCFSPQGRGQAYPRWRDSPWRRRTGEESGDDARCSELFWQISDPNRGFHINFRIRIINCNPN